MDTSECKFPPDLFMLLRTLLIKFTGFPYCGTEDSA